MKRNLTMKDINSEEATHFFSNYYYVDLNTGREMVQPIHGPEGTHSYYILESSGLCLLWSFYFEHDLVLKVKEIYFNRNFILAKFKEGDLYD